MSVFQGVLHHDGVSNGIVYGIYPLTAQLIAMGAVAAGLQAAREDWPGFGIAIAVMCIAAAGRVRGTARGVADRRDRALRRRSRIQRRSGMAATPMSHDALDPLIHVPARLQIVATLAALPDGDALSFLVCRT